MAQQQQQPLEPLFKQLDGFIQEEEYQKVTKACDKILAIAPQDPDAIKCKVVAFIKLGQIANALAVLETPGLDKKVASELLFEKAYCLYRNKKYEDALDTIKGITTKPTPVRVLELEAQIRYKLENYEQSIAVYEELLKQKVDSSELKTNLCAAYTEAGMHKENLFFVEKKENKSCLQDTYEFAFNAACAFIAVGDYAKAEAHLQLAKKVCTDSLTEDGVSAAEIQQELAILQVQLAYCQQLAGQLESATNLFNEVIKSKTTDQVALALATNNSIVLKKGTDVFESNRRLRNATSEAVEQKLTPSQRKTLAFNKTVLLLHTAKADQVRAGLEQLEKSGADAEGLVLLNASLLVKEKKPEDAEKLLTEYARKNPLSLRVPLSIAQIHLSKNAFAPALAVLESLHESHKYKPTIISTITSLYEKAGDTDGAIRLLDNYVAWAEKQKNLDVEQVASILSVNGEFKLQHKKYEQAYEVFEKIFKKNRDIKAVAKLVLAASHFNPSLVQKYEDKIPAHEGSVDVDGLESQPVPSLRKQAAPATPVVAGEEKVVKKKETKKKKRKPRLPKNYNPSATPDPERWLPKWQRSYYKKKQKKGQLGKGTQGLALPTSSVQQMSTPKATPTTPTKTAPAPAPAPLPSTAKAQAKKKKKGKN